MHGTLMLKDFLSLYLTLKVMLKRMAGTLLYRCIVEWDLVISSIRTQKMPTQLESVSLSIGMDMTS